MLLGWYLPLFVFVALFVPAAPTCITSSEEDATTLVWEGETYSVFPLAIGTWSASLVTGAVVSTILEDQFKLTVSKVYGAGSPQLIQHVLGCTDANGDFWDSTTHPTEADCSNSDLFQNPPLRAWAGVDVWFTTAISRVLAKQLTYEGKMGYSTTPGLFTQNTTISAGRAADPEVFLSWYETYTLPGISAIFSNVSDLDRLFRNLTVTKYKDDLCPDGNCHGILTPSCINGKSDVDDYLAQLGKHELCTDDGWWLAPACRNDPDSCIPVLLAEASWHFVSWATVAMNTGMPFAMTWFGWEGAKDAIPQLPDERFIFYAWAPDDSLLAVNPQQVVFDEKVVITPQVTLPEIIIWEGVAEANSRVFTFLRLVSFSYSDVEGMLEGMMDSRDENDVACQWLQDNQATWKAWIPALPNATVTIVNEGGRDALTATLSGVSGAVGTILICIVPCILWKSWRVIQDSPDHEKSPTGQWFIRVAGRSRMSILREVNGNNHRRSRSRCFVVNATPFTLSVTAPHAWRGELRLRSGDFTRARGLKWFPRETLSLKIKSYDFPYEFYSVIAEDDWRVLQTSGPYVFTHEDFLDESIPEVSGLKKQIKYTHRCARKPLPCVGRDEMPLGALRLVRGPNMSVLITWSPPHVLRGMPIRQMEEFLDKVIHHNKTWPNCWDIDDCGNAVQSVKPPGTGSRNMYDACDYIVVPEAAAYDASYSEIFADYGPAAVFLSHVWGEEAQNTKAALEKLRDFVLTKQIGRTNMNFRGHFPAEETSMEDPTTVDNLLFRVYFCVTCNNQSRIAEELGNKVIYSPFARVLQTRFCFQVALISPLKALHRKWCNYEYCFARKLKKPVFMLTSDGIVDQGQVPPKTMRDLAKTVTTFNCRNAKCASAADEKFINDAVEEMDIGGYDTQTEIIKEIFSAAILHAHELLERALHTVEGGLEDESPTKSEMLTFQGRDKAVAFENKPVNMLEMEPHSRSGSDLEDVIGGADEADTISV